MKNTRCEEIFLQLVVRRYDDMGRPVKEVTTQPVKVFRNAQTRDFWAEVDKAVADVATQMDAAEQPPAPLKAAKKTKP